MKFIAWIFIVVNIYMGLNAALNALGILQSSKYSKISTIVFAILILGMGIGGVYFAVIKNNYKAALWLGIGPWILALVFLLINMMTADYK